MLIHIGYHKTASTWLQRELCRAESKHFIPLCEHGSPRRLGRLLITGDDGYLLPPYQLQAPSFPAELEKAPDAAVAGCP